MRETRLQCVPKRMGSSTSVSLILTDFSLFFKCTCLGSVYISVHMCVTAHEYTVACNCVHGWVEAQGWHWFSSSSALHLTQWVMIGLALLLTSLLQRSPPPPPACWDYKQRTLVSWLLTWVLGTQIPVTNAFVTSALPLSHLNSPVTAFFPQNVYSGKKF